MLDWRVYRASFLPAVFALIVAAFSLGEPPRGSGTSLAPDAFVGARAFDGAATSLQTLATAFPRRPPGGAADNAIAGRMVDAFRAAGLQTIIRRFSADTAVGHRRMQDVIGVRAGVSNRRVVVLAHRDALDAPATADLSGTATLAELARVFTGHTLRKTLVLVSTSGGSGGSAGAAAFARAPGGPVDSVVVLGDLASRRVRGPLVVPWSNTLGIGPLALQRTAASALALETGRRVSQAGVASQFARLAVPLTVSEQGEVAAPGLPAVLVSVAGERGPGAATAVSQDRLQEMGRSVLRTISALDGRPAPIPGPRAELFYRSKVVPAWAVRLVVGTLILPALLAAVDGFARARRRREPVARWLAWTLAGAVPFVAAWLFALFLELTGLLPVSPPAPVPAGVIPLDGAGTSAMVAVLLVVVVGWLALRPAVLRLARARAAPDAPGAAAAVLLVLGLLSATVWAANPFAAALLLPGLHLALLLLAPEVRLRRGLGIVLVVVGLVPLALVTAYYADQFGLSLGEIPWTALLLVVGRAFGLPAVLAWCVGLGLIGSILAILHARGRRREGEAPRSRGSITYAGPGSLGGTRSAIRR
jgi:Peptidase family M28